MRVVFMGTADFAVPTIERLAASRHELAAVYTQPPRPKGRGQKMALTPVHERAQALGLPLRTPASLKAPDVQAEFSALGGDVGVVAAYGLLLPQPVLDAPRLGCINVHGSLLPRWRGAAPVERAIEAGDDATGVQLFQMEKGLDTGPVFASTRVPIGKAATAPELRALLAERGAELVLDLLDDLESGEAAATPQEETGASYAHKIDKAEYALDLTAPAALLERRVRAFYPQAWVSLDGDRLRVLEADVIDATGSPGQTLDDALTVACGIGAIRPRVVQPAGKRPMPVADFLRGRKVPVGQRLA